MEQWLDYTFGGHSCRLYFDGSLYVEDLNTLFLSDIHLGKGGQFRKEGIPTPIAVHRFGMKRLSAAIDRHPTSTVIFLGDLFEGAQNKETSELLDFIKDRSERNFILVKGNHDSDQLGRSKSWLPLTRIKVRSLRSLMKSRSSEVSLFWAPSNRSPRNMTVEVG